MRPIDADELLKKINDVYNGYMLSEQFAPTDFERMIEEAPTVEMVPAEKWIPVTERLPEVEEEATRCLVTVDVCGSFDDYTAIRTYFSDTKDFNDVVTAWMPLPKPYEGGE